MNIDEFRTKAKIYRRFEILSGFVFIALIGVAGLPTLFIAKRVDTLGFDALCVWVTCISFPAIAVLMFYFLARFPKQRARRLGLTCPSCGRALVAFTTTQVVIATGRCGFCGAQMLESA
jgi:ribosomal protein S27E